MTYILLLNFSGWLLVRQIAKVVFFRILRTTAYSTIALTLCAWIVQSSRYLDMLSQYNISLARFFKFSSYLCVDIVAIILPISLAVSSAFVFYRFIQSNQLIAMQSSGMSPLTLLRPLMILAAISTAYLYVSNAYISPYAWSSFRRMEFEIKNNIEPPESAGSIVSMNDFSVYAQEYVGNFSFKNLFVLDLREPQKSFSYYAQSGSIKSNTLFMENGERIEVDGVMKKNSITRFKKYQYDLREILNVERKAAQPNEKSIKELLDGNKNDAAINTTLIALFHQKMTSPLLAFIFSLLSFLLITMAPYRRGRKYSRIFFLVVLIVVFQGTYFWITNAAAKDLMFIKYVYALVVVPFAVLPLLILLKNR